VIRLFKVAMAEDAPAAVQKVLESGYIGQGPRVEEFEQALARALDAPFVPLSLNSGTSALDLALHLIGVGPGDEVISTPMTCTASNAVIVNRGASIVWADVDRLTGLISPEDVELKLTARTKAIMAVDWGGKPCEYDHLCSFGVPVIEDAAHAFLATSKGESIARSGGDYICWSFQAIKHLTTGDGGALLPPPENLERGRLLRWYGLDRRQGDSFRCEQEITEAGFKYHMNDIAAAIGLANLALAQENVAKHRANAEFYNWALWGKVHDPDSSYWLFTILVKERDKFIQHMREREIEVSPVHSRNDRQRAFRFPCELPGVDFFAEHEVAIPCGWWLSEKDRERVLEEVRSYERRSDQRALAEAGNGSGRL